MAGWDAPDRTVEDCLRIASGAIAADELGVWFFALEIGPRLNSRGGCWGVVPEVDERPWAV